MNWQKEKIIQDAKVYAGTHAPLYSRSFGAHLRALGIGQESLQGERILALGPGADFAFEKGAIESGAASVTALGYFDRTEGALRHEVDALKETHPEIRLVNALFEALPEDELKPFSYTKIFSVWGFPMYSDFRHPSARGSMRYQGMMSTLRILFHSLDLFGHMKFAQTGMEVGRYMREVLNDFIGKKHVSVQRRKNSIIDTDAVLTITRKR